MNRFCKSVVFLPMLFFLAYGCKKNSNCGVIPVTNDVVMQNTVFVPAIKTVSRGTTVTWINKDSYAHTVTSNDNLFDSGNLNSGQTFQYTFNTAGTFNYYCRYHQPMMKGTIIVN